MNSRQRFLAVMKGEKVDEIPFFEEEIREEVLAEWRRQGLDSWVTEENCLDYFGLDRRETISVRFSPVEGGIEGKEDLERVIRHYREHPVEFLQGEFWEEKARHYHGRDFPLGTIGWNGFQLPLFPPDPENEHNEWENLVNLYCQLRDNPEAVKEALSFIADYYISITALACKHLELDFIILSEPIASASGPVISPRDFNEFVVPQYRKLVSAYRRMGIPQIVFRSISNIRPLLPTVIETGFDGIWITQIMNAGIDYVQLGEQYPDMALMGGIESIALLESGASVTEEVRRKAIPLLKRGRWLPALDDNVRVNIPYKRFLKYRRVLLACCAGQGLR